MKFSHLLLAGAMAFGSLSSAQAADKYTFDQLHSQVLFFVDHMGFAKSEGEFLKIDGSFTVDEADLSKSTIDVSIPIDSLEMDDEKWNEHVKSADLFDAAQFPTMTFKSTSVAVTGEKTADVTGDLTLHGVTKPVVLKVTHNKTGPNPMTGKSEIGFSATASLKRSDFGMSYGIPNVGDDVEIRLEVEAIKEEPAGADAGN